MDTSQQPTLEERLAVVSNLMSLQMQPFVTPISGALTDGTAVHVGTGGYVEWRRRRLMLTNEHVAREVNKHSLARKCFDSPDYLHINNPYQVLTAPADLAFSPVDDRWNAVAHSAMSFPDYRFEEKHAPVQGEYLFVMGFTGEKARYSPSFNMLFTTGTPYLTQEYDETLEPEETRRPIKHPDFDPACHFAMQWHPEATTPTDGRTSSIPLDPHGMSGSLVWNTRLQEFAAKGEPWTPGVARLSGVLWGWDTGDRFLFATRIEHVAAFLSRFYP
ncbi:hypothetical protein [Rhizobium leguminosarum]|uniref:hypothetical protein n=1 Tax=Rhizobium leguminosarum TaxID=384 RepID=UPI00161A55F8|nr:hypothetical protein [Rhizobium leguminosarum]MBB4506321.1 hypothetical protein [Rhizobium leguminosarum]